MAVCGCGCVCVRARAFWGIRNQWFVCSLASFYPLYPAQPSTPVELSKQHHAKMTVTPDVLLLPSQLAYFARVVNNVVVVNPGVLTKGNSAGTYGKLTVFPMRSSHVEAGASPTPGWLSFRCATAHSLLSRVWPIRRAHSCRQDEGCN